MTSSSRTLHLDHARKKFLGVCAGVANYLDVEPWSVRMVFIGCCIFGGWFLIPLYFAVWFLLDDASRGVRDSITDNLAVKHFRTVDYRKKIYRNKRDAKWLGVCAGIADYLEVSAFAVRLVFLLLFFTTGGFPLLFYLAASLVIDVRPDELYQERATTFAQGGPQAARPDAADASPGSMQPPHATAGSRAGSEEEFHSRRREINYSARKLASLQERLARMEAYVTSSRFKLHREFRNIS
jgi:phage shock protein C